ncbi:MAG: ketol-acid reductoisomerase [Deltaproteobacteria bacterium]|nr:ketol-acid reductoisomerase [Deltaproteobacteria bacterium]
MDSQKATLPKFERLKKTRLGLLGYGAQGSAEAQNLKRSGVEFLLGLRDGASKKRAIADGFSVLSIEEVAAQADSIAMNLPDQDQAQIYEEFLKNRPVKRLVFAHGFNTHFKLIPVLENGPRHFLVAPKGAASGLQEFYGTKNALPAILAIQGVSADANADDKAEKKWAEEYAIAIGCNSRALIWADFKDETDCDLFAEQVLLCGGVSSLLRKTYEVMVEAGYHPEAAYFESLFELKLIVDLLWNRGITGMREKISPTARFGDITRGDRVIDDSVKKKMQEILKEIQSGEFAKEFLKNNRSENYLALAKKQSEHPLEVMGKKMRDQLNNNIAG